MKKIKISFLVIVTFILVFRFSNSMGTENPEVVILGPAVLSPFIDGKNWYLSRDLHYKIGETDSVIIVPEGFVTDFTSIPRVFWTILPSWGKYGIPAIVHDWMYWSQLCTRKEADRMMLIAMREYNVGPIYRWAINRALRIGGSFAWNSNAKNKNRGVIKAIPKSLIFKLHDNPNITFKDFSSKFLDGQKENTSTERPKYCDTINKVIEG